MIYYDWRFMELNKISNGLRKQRENSGLSVKQAIDALKEYGIVISEKTLYAWEVGRNMPDADALLALCDIYATPDILAAFGYTKESLKKNSAAEAADIIHRLSPGDREYIIGLARRLEENKQTSRGGN